MYGWTSVCICTYVRYVQWLLCLQRIESLAGRCFSLRASCGVYLKRTGTLKRAMDLFMNLVPNLVKQRYVSVFTSLCPSPLLSHPFSYSLTPSFPPPPSLILPFSYPPARSQSFSLYYYLHSIPYHSSCSLISHFASRASSSYHIFSFWNLFLFFSIPSFPFQLSLFSFLSM